MRFLSTGGQSPPADFKTALLEGLAPDGGLYMPETLPRWVPSLSSAAPVSMAETGAEVLLPFLDGIAETEARRLISDALDFDVPLVEIEDGVGVLEVFHGPTFAFKDVAARFLARFLGWFCRGSERPLTVLVATSGDTGSAVAHAFLGVEGTRIVVLYPKGKVSPLQEKQITTLGQNVAALEVEGTFDDCQRLVKQAFRDEELREELFLTSANSISIGRLLPQMVYYVYGLAQLGAGAAPPIISVPSGNFGNLTAGLMAHQSGLGVEKFVAATNVNDTVPEFLLTGLYRARPSTLTMSNAMDVGDPSNFVRMMALYGDELDAVRQDVRGFRFDDEATRGAIRDVRQRTGYLLDPHTAVGYLALKAALAEEREERSGIVVATAHPVKFREHVEPLIGSTIPVPERLARCLERPSRARPMRCDFAQLKSFLLTEPG